MFQHFIDAAKALNLDIDKIYRDCVISAVQAEQLKEAKRKMRREMT